MLAGRGAGLHADVKGRLRRVVHAVLTTVSSKCMHCSVCPSVCLWNRSRESESEISAHNVHGMTVSICMQMVTSCGMRVLPDTDKVREVNVAARRLARRSTCCRMSRCS